jgi:hypothetical protein
MINKSLETVSVCCCLNMEEILLDDLGSTYYMNIESSLALFLSSNIAFNVTIEILVVNFLTNF